MGINRERLSFAIKCLDGVFEKGEKIPLNDRTNFIFDIFNEIYSKRMLIENPQEYFKSDKYEGIGDISNVSLAYQAVEQRRYYDTALKKKNALNVRTMGSKISQPDNDKLVILADASAGFIFPSTPSLQGLYEFLKVLDKKLDGDETVKQKPVYIHVKKNKVMEMLTKALGLTEKALAKFGIYGAGNAQEIAENITERIKARKFNDELEFNINKNATFYVATTSDKKLLEMQKFYENYGIKVKSLTELVGSFKDADELHGTIETNAIGTNNAHNSGKLYTIKEKLASIPPEELRRMLIERGDDPNNTFIFTDDRGAIFSPIVAKKMIDKFGHNMPAEIHAMLFSKYGYETTADNKSLPGSEVKHLMDAAGGQGHFWESTSAITTVLDKIYNYIENSIAVAISPIMDVYKEKPRILSTSAKVKYKIIAQAAPDAPYKESEQHTASFDEEDKTLAQITAAGDWDKNFKYTDIGRAFKALADTFNLEVVKSTARSLFSGYQIGLVSSKPYDIGDYKVNNMHDAKDMLNAKKADDLMGDNHCFVFDGNISKDDISAVGHAFFKTVVAKQTDPRDMNKLVVVNNPNEHFDKIINLYYSLYDEGYIKQYPPRMFSVVQDKAQLTDVIDAHTKQYSSVEFQYNSTEPAHKIEPKRESVFIACSATSDTPENVHLSEKAAFHLALAGKDIIYGGGDKKMMGGIYHGYLLAKKYAEGSNLEFTSELIASSTDNLMKIETIEGKKPENVKPENFYLAPTIDHRKSFLFGSSTSLIVLPGGAGTEEELLYCNVRKKNDPRDYQINVLNQNNVFQYLKDATNGDIKYYSHIDNILANSYGIKMSESKAASEFLEREIAKPRSGIDIISVEDATSKERRVG